MGSRHLALARKFFPDAEIKVLRHSPSSVIPENSNGQFYSQEDAINFAPHIAIIASPASFHLGISTALAQVGAHLLIEKPLSDSAWGASDLINICRKKGLVLAVGYNIRHSESLQYFRQILKAEAIGKILSVRCEVGQHLNTWRTGTDYRLGVSARKELGGGVLLELSHELDYLRWIFGEISWVSAVLSRQSSLEIDVEDSASLIFGFKSNITKEQLIASLNLDFIRHDRTRSCIAIGEKASLKWNGLTEEVEIFESGDRVWRSIFKGQSDVNETYEKEWQNFLQCIDEKKTPLASGIDGLRVLEIIQAAHQSSASGATIDILVSPHENLAQE